MQTHFLLSPMSYKTREENTRQHQLPLMFPVHWPSDDVAKEAFKGNASAFGWQTCAIELQQMFQGCRDFFFVLSRNYFIL